MKTDFEIITTRLLLRPYKIVDLNDLLDAIQSSVTELSPWLAWCSDDYDQHDAYEWINASRQNWQNDVSYELAIIDQDTERLLGSISLNNISAMLNSAELGYWICTKYHQQGIATEACQAIAEFAFNTLGLTRVEIVTHTGNLASQRTALACQAKFECTARNRIYAHGKAYDGLVFSLIPEDIQRYKPTFPAK
ncbi:GNAT family N-acetyltransferase [Photobacterium sp. SDRW27]|uniref:GNAT family N-acetyltransferase n=1 Tax=Photobacterium obscurum TaxID=2829490 RepID=UPI002243FE3A|nr:GNAT family protein [Photobacterium obscurum]MCW8327288.1 GNAT family N-acetyltransferase [Photobacterium obscurum]